MLTSGCKLTRAIVCHSIHRCSHTQQMMTSVIDVILLLLLLLAMTSLRRCNGVNLMSATESENNECSTINMRPFQDPDIEITQIACRNVTSIFTPVSDFTVTTNTSAPPLAQGPATSCSTITMSWNLPVGEYGVSSSQLNFFEIRLTSYDHISLDQSRDFNREQQAVQCVQYKPTNQRPATSSKQQFQYTVIVPKSIYFVQLFTFSTVAAVGSRFLVTQSLIRIAASRNNENVNVVVRNDSCSQSATVTLQFASPATGWTGYRTLCVDKHDRTVEEIWVPVNQSRSHGVAVFKNLSIGKYSIKILPCRSYQHGSSDYSADDDSCSHEITVSAEFFISPVNFERDCKLKGPPVMTLQQIVAAICGIAAAVLVTTLSICVYKSVRMMKPLKKSRTKKRKVLLIYIQDDRLHKKVIEALHAFLEKYCNLDVTAEFTTDQRIIALSRTNFVLESFERADMALVVISDGLRQRWDHMRHGVNNRDVGASTNDLLLNYLRQRMICDIKYDILHSVVFARFDYTASSLNQDRLISYGNPIHVLMRDINNMVHSLHGIEKHTRRTLFCFLPTWYGMTSKYSAEGRELMAAIKCVTDRQSSAADAAESNSLLRSDAESPMLQTEPVLYVVPVPIAEQLPQNEDLHSRAPETTNVTSTGETSGFYSDDHRLHSFQTDVSHYSELAASLLLGYRDECVFDETMAGESSADCEIDYEYFTQLNCDYDTS